MEQFNKFQNKNYYIIRSTDYQESGRVQTKEEAEKIDKIVENVLNAFNIEHKNVEIDDAAGTIINDILEILKK